MLRTWNAENTNRLGPSQRAAGKSFKALGDAGQGSENPPPPSGKGMLQQKQRKLKPLGSYSENAPPSVAKGKVKAAGLGLLPTSSSKQPQQKQRRALGDISNAPAKPSLSLSGKQSTTGLSFAVHSDSGKVNGAGSSETTKVRGSGSRVATTAAVKGRGADRPEEHVDDVEVALGRMGDEEEVLVERRAEQRATAAAAAALQFAARSKLRTRSRSRSQSTSAAFTKPSKSACSSGSTSKATSKTRFGRDITNTAAGAGGGSVTAEGTCDVAACGGGALDKSLDSTIDRICLNDFEDGKMELVSGKESAHTLLQDDGEIDMDMDSLTMALEGHNLNLDCLPDDLVDDEGFLTQEMDLCLSFV